MSTISFAALTDGVRGGSNRRLLAILAAALLTISFVMPVAAKKPTDPPGQLVPLQLLAFNDYHGHLAADTPGTVGTTRAGGASTSPRTWRPANGQQVSADGGRRRPHRRFALPVGPLRDEPSVESLNALGLDVSSVGNHEFDDGVTELLRMQNGGCHPVDGCYFPAQPYPGPTSSGWRRTSSTRRPARRSCRPTGSRSSRR